MVIPLLQFVGALRVAELAQVRARRGDTPVEIVAHDLMPGVLRVGAAPVVCGLPGHNHGRRPRQADEDAEERGVGYSSSLTRNP
jgi:hypothetical protein